MPSLVGRKLGKLPPRHDPRTLMLASYLDKKLPPIPASCDWTPHGELGMMGNDRFGDCGFAGQGHAVQTWTAGHGVEVTVPDADVLAAYSGCTGFTPGDASTDNGVVLLDALNYWRTTGIGGYQISAYVRVDPKNLAHVRAAIYLFGGVYTGAALPISAQSQDVWTGVAVRRGHHLNGPDAPGSWGGHCMWAPRYTASDTTFTFVTWGERKNADATWWLDYVDECYAIISPQWVSAAAKAPEGFDLAALTADLARL